MIVEGNNASGGEKANGVSAGFKMAIEREQRSIPRDPEEPSRINSAFESRQHAIAFFLPPPTTTKSRINPKEDEKFEGNVFYQRPAFTVEDLRESHRPFSTPISDPSDVRAPKRHQAIPSDPRSIESKSFNSRRLFRIVPESRNGPGTRTVRPNQVPNANAFAGGGINDSPAVDERRIEGGGGRVSEDAESIRTDLLPRFDADPLPAPLASGDDRNLRGFATAGSPPRLRVPEEREIRFVVAVTPVASLGNEAAIPEGERIEANGNPKIDKFLSILAETNRLPEKFNPRNLDRGIKTLAFILERLRKEKQIESIQKALVADAGSATDGAENGVKNGQSFPEKSGTSTPGRPGIDYPIHSTIPKTKFDCSSQRYKGFFGDPDTDCQVWHYCDLNGGQASFLCPNGTIFSQVGLTCDWWFNVKCESTSQLYVLNERLYKYILPFSPSFPEDFSGPVVDRYLTAKFEELERKKPK